LPCPTSKTIVDADEVCADIWQPSRKLWNFSQSIKSTYTTSQEPHAVFCIGSFDRLKASPPVMSIEFRSSASDQSHWDNSAIMLVE
jgi:hypothetical protein